MSEPRVVPPKITNSAATATLPDDVFGGSGTGLVLVANTGTMTLTLPTAVNNAGKRLIFKKTTSSATAITVDANASETIDGATTHTAMDAQYDTITIMSDGANWHIVAQKIA
jgi:hypothetical protein